MKTSFKTWVLRIGLGCFVDVNICVMKYYFYLVTSYSPSLKSNSTQILRPQKGNSGVSFNDTH